MKPCLLFLFVVLLLVPPAEAQSAQPETLLGLSIDTVRKTFTIQVKSGGCTKKSSFFFQIKNGVLTILRRVPDDCKRVPFRDQLTFTFHEVGLNPNQTFRIANPISIQENIW